MHGNKDANPSALTNLLSQVLSLANTLSVSDTFIKHGLTISEWTLLNEFPADGSEILLRKLGALTGLSSQRVKVLVAKLESKGIVQEPMTAEVRRSRRYAITPAGASLKSDAERVISDMQVAMLSLSQIRGLARSARVVRRLLKTAAQKQPAC